MRRWFQAAWQTVRKLCLRSVCSGTWQSFSTESGTVGKFCRCGTQVNNHMLCLLVSIKELWNWGLCLLHYLLVRSLWAQSSTGNYYQVLCKGRWGFDVFFSSREKSVIARLCNTKIIIIIKKKQHKWVVLPNEKHPASNGKQTRATSNLVSCAVVGHVRCCVL